MIKNRLKIYLVATLAMFACEPDPLPIHLELPAQQLVVSSLLIQGQGVTIALTRSFSALNSGLTTDSTLLTSLLVQEAEVLIIENRLDTFRLQQVQDGIFVSADINPVPGNVYGLIATDLQTGTRVEAESIVTEQVQFSDTKGTLIPAGDDSLVNVSYSFNPHPDEDFYMVNVQKLSVDLDQTNLGIDLDLVVPRTFTHLVTKTDSGDQEISDEFIFIVNEDFFTGDTLIVSLASIGPTYYEYLEKRNNTRFGPSFVSEPYNAPSNVENGLGFFNLHTSDNQIIIVE
ncbi:MAG: DUF4249 family protein [Reichenbachiella sp.]|uniref:DUF4249 family protein n=2 Tax=Reichenbachiella sp. TaxID=2184521 RepID=UPI0032652463